MYAHAENEVNPLCACIFDIAMHILHTVKCIFLINGCCINALNATWISRHFKCTCIKTLLDKTKLQQDNSVNANVTCISRQDLNLCTRWLK